MEQNGQTRILVKAVALDLLAGLAATGLYVLFAIYSYRWRGLGTIMVAVCLVFTAAALIRGKSAPTNAWLKALILISILILETLTGQSALFYVVINIVVAYGSSLAAIHARRCWAAGAQIGGLLILGVTLGLVEAAGVIGAPILLEKMLTRTGNVPAPEFSFRRLSGGVVESSQFRDRVVVLYFWASWCPPCRQEFPQLESLYEKYAVNSYVQFLAVDTPGYGESLKDAKSFMASGGYAIPAAFDDQADFVRFRLRMVPSLVILDRSWHIRLVHTGYDGSEHYVENLSREIDELLKGPAPAAAGRE